MAYPIQVSDQESFRRERELLGGRKVTFPVPPRRSASEQSGGRWGYSTRIFDRMRDALVADQVVPLINPEYSSVCASPAICAGDTQ